jgi:hypothetical protein
VAGDRRSGAARPASKTPDRACDPLGLLIDEERNRTEHPLLEALLEARSGDQPPAIRAAAESLLRSSAPWSLELDGLLLQLLDACGDHRSRRLFLEWSLLRRDRPTLATLAASIGLSRRRTRELVDQSEVGVRSSLARAHAPVPWAVATLRRRLGAITTDERAHAAVAGLGVSSAPGADLLLWLSGPYRELAGHPEWLGHAGTDVVARTKACLSADGGVRRRDDVVQEIDQGMPAGQIDEWLSACGAAVVSDVVVSVSGPLVDVVERVLDAHGTSLTPDEISRCVAAGGRDLDRDKVFAVQRSHRFRTEVDGRLALADWDGPGGAAPEISLAAPRGSRRRAARRDPAPAVGEDGRLMLWVRIDIEALRGGEASVPLSLVEGLGVAPGCRRIFSSRYGPIALAHFEAAAKRGSVRAVALAAGAGINDTLLLSFSARGDIDVGVRRHTGDNDITDPTSTAADIFPRSAIPGAT